MGVGPLVIANSWHLWQLSPLQLDLRIQLCMVVRMCVCPLACMCVYEAICSAVKISTVESPRDKASTDIVPPRVGRLSFPLSIGHLGKGQAEKLNQPMGERRESHIVKSNTRTSNSLFIRTKKVSFITFQTI